MSDRVEQILDVAERMARTGGYAGFSFREIAKEVGIKPASVHYHFPEKEALGAALAERYTERFMAGLGDPADLDRAPEILVRRMVAAYRHSIFEEGLMCLCGMFGAEAADLPPRVQAATRVFFERNLAWLRVVLNRMPAVTKGEPSIESYRILATLEGALLLARGLNDAAAFDNAVKGIGRIA